MLYPIELLRQTARSQVLHGAEDGVHVNGQGCICHVIHRAFCTKRQALAQACCVHRANCIAAKSHHCKMQFEEFLKTIQLVVFKGFIAR